MGKPRPLQRLDIYVDVSDSTLKSKEYIFPAGDTNTSIETSVPQFTHNTLLMHGIKTAIYATVYVVIYILISAGIFGK